MGVRSAHTSASEVLAENGFRPKARSRFHESPSGIRFSAIAIAVFAQASHGEWQSYNTGDGLAASYVLSITEDREGNLWIGTESGLVSQYDGVRWSTLPIPGGLAQRVNAIVEDSSGDLWFATEGAGVARYGRSAWTLYSTADGLAEDNVKAALEDRTGDLWFATYGNGVCRYDGVRWRTYTTADGLADNGVYTILEDRSGLLWFGTYGGISRYDGTTWRTYTVSDGLVEPYVFAIVEDLAGNIWYGTQSGFVGKFDGAVWTTYTEDDGLPGAEVEAMIVDAQGDIWVATDGGGVSRFDGRHWRTYTAELGLASDSVEAIHQDCSGNLWFGTYGGLSRYDGASWRTFGEAQGLGNREVWPIFKDRVGRMWFGTSGGVVSYDGVTWEAHLAGMEVRAICEDPSGTLWFGTQWGSGVFSFDGVNWRSLTLPAEMRFQSFYSILKDRTGSLWLGTGATLYRHDGVNWTTYSVEDQSGAGWVVVRGIMEDGAGNLWFAATDGGALRFDGRTWTTFTEATGLVNNRVYGIVEDGSGGVWFATYGGVSHFDGEAWESYTTADGLAHDHVFALLKDGMGDLWFGTEGGVSLYDGEIWATYTTADGLVGNSVRSLAGDDAGALWFGDGGGVSAYEPDRVTPQTVIWPRLPSVSASRRQVVAFAAGFKEREDVDFSTSLGEGAWSEWSGQNVWVGEGLADGCYVLRVRTRDRAGNVDSTPAVFAFEVDAQLPQALILSPSSGEAVRDSLLIRGEADDPRFKQYRLEVRSVVTDPWQLLSESTTPVTNGLLGGWNTKNVTDGEYELRLSVMDTLGLNGVDVERVVVDNQFPPAERTSPAIVVSEDGGEVFTTDQEVHLYFAPRAFSADALVTIIPSGCSSSPEVSGSGNRSILAGYRVSWGDQELRKPAILNLSLENVPEEVPRGMLAIHYSVDCSSWERIGGTPSEDGTRLSTSIRLGGVYVVDLDAGPVGNATTLSTLGFTPRIFSPDRASAAHEVAIDFSLGRRAEVTIKVYNRAGRLVKELVSTETLNAGVNLVRWNGRDLNGLVVPDGLYLVSVEALGHRQTATIAVVR